MNNNEMHDRLDKLEDKIDKIQENTSDMKVILAKNTADVEYHIRRSDNTDELVSIMNKRVSMVEDSHKKATWMISVVIALASIAAFLKEMSFI